MDFDYMHMVGGKKPAGIIEITENGEYDVAEYAKASVNVEAAGGDEMFNALVSGNISGSLSISNVETVRDNAFSYTNIESVYINDAVYIGNSAFAYCKALKQANIPNVENIESSAFRECVSLNYIDIELVKNVKTYAFYRCNIEKINSQNLAVIGSDAFRECNSLSCVNIPIATSIGLRAFRDCSSMKKINAKKLEQLTNSIFYGCNSLVSVDILGGSIIYSDSLYGCTSLKSLVIRGTVRITTLNTNSGIENCPNLTVYVPDELVDSYKVATNWSVIADRIRPLSEYVEEV